MPHAPGDVMSDRPVAFDLSRLVTRLTHTTPTGIDRVDRAYARWLFDGSPARFGVVSTPLGPRVVRPAAVADLLATLDRRWADSGAAEDDPAYRMVAAKLGWSLPGPARCRTGRADRPPILMKAMLLKGSRGIDALPRGTVYLHTSHLRLERPARFAWLDARPDIRAVFFVHDLIPIEHPEFGRPGEDERHRVRLATVARHARAVMVNSAVVRESLLAHWSQEGLPAPPVAVAPLGVEPVFLQAVAPGEVAPFFVVCGTIEPRKNHAHLLHVWRRLAGAGGAVPKLVIAGRRGWESESVIDMLERAPFVRDHVVEISGLSTPGLARVMGLARGVLMPSFAEGYGLPVAEALSLGVPVVASDIPVHREVAGDRATFVDPIDGPGWIAAVRALATAPRRPTPLGAGPYRPPTWATHLAIAADVVAATVP